MDAAPPPKLPSRVAKFAPPLVALLVGTGLGFGTAELGLLSGGSGAATAAQAEQAAAAEEGAAEGEAAPAGGHGEAAPAEGEAAPPGANGEPAPSHGGGGGAAAADAKGSAITSLGTFTVNLRGTGGGRVLRLEVQVEGPGAQAETIKARSAQLRDSIITAVSDYTWSELEGAGGKSRLRDELFARVNGAAAPSIVERIYFTQFVVQ
jgi:flagellar basal body-associated protein FliL